MLKTPYQDTPELRQAIIDSCKEMNSRGINQGTSGNISARAGDRMIITPSGVPYDRMTPEMLASIPLDGDSAFEGPLPPSTEWQFHLALLRYDFLLEKLLKCRQFLNRTHLILQQLLIQLHLLQQLKHRIHDLLFYMRSLKFK